MSRKVTPISTPIQPPKEEPVHKVHYERVRDNIIAYVRKHWKLEAWCEPFTTHMAQMAWNSLDTYNELTFKLPEKRTIHFTTTLYKGGEFTYTLESYDAAVPVDMKKKTFLGFEI